MESKPSFAFRDRMIQYKGLEKRRLSVLTAYDYPLARLLDEAGIDMILVGDSLGMVVLGLADTTQVTLADMVHHTRAAARGVRSATVIADLPFGTYTTAHAALLAARKLLEAGAFAVKLEGGKDLAPVIETLVQEGIPVVGHLGMLPQRIHEEGGRYRVKGKTQDEAEALLADALAIQQAGAAAVVLELVVPEVAGMISKALDIPSIGIGSGTQCDGEILVTHDLVGLFPWFRPGFVKPRVEVAQQITEAVRGWIESVHKAPAISPDVTKLPTTDKE